MRKAYLTIDDTPSARTNDLVDALIKRSVPAILFCRGDLLEENPEPVIRAIQKGFMIGNHGYHHKRASVLGYDAACKNIDHCDALIETCYQKAGVKRHGKYYRFAYMDRGMGPWFVEPASVNSKDRPYIETMIREGLANDPSILPDAKAVETKNKLQTYLKSRGYTQAPFSGVTHSFYQNSEMRDAVDAMFTYSTSDWAITARHKGKYGFDTVQDLKHAIDQDPHLKRDDTAHIILAHDQAEIHDATIALVDHLLHQGMTFREFA